MKYVIDTDFYSFGDSFVGALIVGCATDGEITCHYDTKDNIDELTAEYINDNFSDLLDNAYAHGKSDAEADFHKAKEEAYQRGLADGFNGEYDESKAYKKGLEDAWEAAKKVLFMNDYQREFVFDSSNIHKIMASHTASEAISKLQAYEQKQKEDAEIKVGDEVKAAFGKAIVTRARMNGNVKAVDYLYGNGDYGWDIVDNVEKTGNHYDITALLEKMKGE